MIVIIGAGICGLGIGWQLAKAGCPVTLVERGEAGRATSWAAGGMLAPQVEAEPGEESLLPLLLESRALWADFAAELAADAGMAVDYRTEGTMVVALHRDDHARLDFLASYYREQGLGVDVLSGREALRREPYLSRRVVGGLYSPLDHQVDNRKVVEAMKRAFLACGGILREACPALRLETAGGRVAGVALADGVIAADAVVLATGPWARELPGLPSDFLAPVRPVKGQMAAVQMNASEPLLRHVVWIPDGYMIPRLDGRLLIGGTVEDVGFDDALTAGGLMDILRNAWEALPGIYDLPIVETWTGYRPTSRDDAPILGPSGLEGLIYALGHHRNGILLAPITARATARYVLEGSLPASVRPFTMARFQADGQPAGRVTG
jgi:glycine oxidase